MGTDTTVMPTKSSPLTSTADRVLDKLVIPGYSSIGPFFRKHWWPADPQPFTRRVDIVVTGGSSGIGAAIAAGLTALGARVHLVGRKADTLQTSASKIRLQQPDAELVVHEADISDLDAVRGLIDTLAGELDQLHGLVHCAGVMPPERKETAQGHEMAFATHVLGPFLLTAGLRPLLQADGDGRVSSASRADFAAAAAVVLTADGHQGRTYELAGDVSWTFDDFAAVLSDPAGRPVTYRSVPTEQHVEILRGFGLDAGTAGFVAALDDNIRHGALDCSSTDLRDLIGRPTTPLAEGLAVAFVPVG